MPNDLILLHCIIKYLSKNKYKLEEIIFPWAKQPGIAAMSEKRINIK